MGHDYSCHVSEGSVRGGICSGSRRVTIGSFGDSFGNGVTVTCSTTGPLPLDMRGLETSQARG